MFLEKDKKQNCVKIKKKWNLLGKNGRTKEPKTDKKIQIRPTYLNLLPSLQNWGF